MTKLEIAKNIDMRINNIDKFLRELDADKLNKHNVQILIRNELMGIQSDCERLGLSYIKL